MRTALIGHTGFIGGNLARQLAFDDVYHSTNIEMIGGNHYGLVVCAGAPGVKYLANKDPERDWQAVSRLLEALATVRADEFVLISSIDVYPTPVIGVDENTPISPETNHPYGKHRGMLEQFVAKRFDARIVRLPSVFGPGIRKNAVYDLMHGKNLELIHQDAVFQFYDARRLAKDLAVARDLQLKLVNFATEPVSIRELARECFRLDFKNTLAGPAPATDLRSVHFRLWDGENGYLYTRAQVLADLRAFLAQNPA